eukprot:1546539-Rhodomonas_salina.3
MLQEQSGAKVAADGRAASGKGLAQLIFTACAAVLPLWVVPRQEARCSAGLRAAVMSLEMLQVHVDVKLAVPD